jgi:uncharacterized membrane protein YcaP (DUF421 family)
MRLDPGPLLQQHESLLKEAGIVFVRTIGLYLVALAVLRITGKRSLDKMNAFDFIVAVTFGSAVAIGMEAENKLLPSVIPIVLLGLLQWSMSRLNIELPTVEGITRGRSVTLVRNGKADQKTLKGERITNQELAMELREKGFSRVDDVATATLETTGKISAFPIESARPLMYGDLKAIAQSVAAEVLRQQKGAAGSGEKH